MHWIVTKELTFEQLGVDDVKKKLSSKLHVHVQPLSYNWRRLSDNTHFCTVFYKLLFDMTGYYFLPPQCTGCTICKLINNYYSICTQALYPWAKKSRNFFQRCFMIYPIVYHEDEKGEMWLECGGKNNDL